MPTTLRGRPRLPVAVEPRDGYRIWLRYADGVEGEVDLSDLAGKGLFVAWRDRVFFENVRIGEWGEIVWGEALDICPDALYLQLTGQSVEDIWPGVTADRQSSQRCLGSRIRHRATDSRRGLRSDGGSTAARSGRTRYRAHGTGRAAEPEIRRFSHAMGTRI